MSDRSIRRSDPDSHCEQSIAMSNTPITLTDVLCAKFSGPPPKMERANICQSTKAPTKSDFMGAKTDPLEFVAIAPDMLEQLIGALEECPDLSAGLSRVLDPTIPDHSVFLGRVHPDLTRAPLSEQCFSESCIQNHTVQRVFQPVLLLFMALTRPELSYNDILTRHSIPYHFSSCNAGKSDPIPDGQFLFNRAAQVLSEFKAPSCLDDDSCSFLSNMSNIQRDLGFEFPVPFFSATDGETMTSMDSTSKITQQIWTQLVYKPTCAFNILTCLTRTVICFRHPQSEAEPPQSQTVYMSTPIDFEHLTLMHIFAVLASATGIISLPTALPSYTLPAWSLGYAIQPEGFGMDQIFLDSKYQASAVKMYRNVMLSLRKADGKADTQLSEKDKQVVRQGFHQTRKGKTTDISITFDRNNAVLQRLWESPAWFCENVDGRMIAKDIQDPLQPRDAIIPAARGFISGSPVVPPQARPPKRSRNTEPEGGQDKDQRTAKRSKRARAQHSDGGLDKTLTQVPREYATHRVEPQASSSTTPPAPEHAWNNTMPLLRRSRRNK